jgi:hypothetical protein
MALDLKDASAAPLRPWQFLAYELRLDMARVEAAALPDPKRLLGEHGLRLSTLARERDRSPEALEAIYRLHRDCYLRQPPTALQRAPIPFHLWRWGSLEARDEALPEAYFLVLAGKRYVGLSTIVRLRRLPGVLECRFTGVLPEFAGRNVKNLASGKRLRPTPERAQHGLVW